MKVKLLPQNPELYVLAQSEDRVAKERSMRRRQLKWLWRRLKELYLRLTQVEEAFKNLKGDLALRPIHHQLEARVEAHIFIAFLAYCLQVTLGRRLRDLAPGLSARAVLEKFAAVQMLDVRLPTSDGREVLLTRYTQPEPELQLLLSKLKLELPAQPPPRISSQDNGHQLKSCSADL